MTIRVVVAPKERDGKMLREALHRAADNLADMYERGDPLWLHSHWVITNSKQGDLQVDIFVKDWI